VFDTVRGYNWPDGITGRALRNDFTARWHGREGELASAIDSEMASYQRASARGNTGTAAVFAGEGVDLIKDVASAGEIVAQLVAEAERALTLAAGRIV
jgi:nitronate monooxygenase